MSSSSASKAVVGFIEYAFEYMVNAFQYTDIVNFEISFTDVTSNKVKSMEITMVNADDETDEKWLDISMEMNEFLAIEHMLQSGRYEDGMLKLRFNGDVPCAMLMAVMGTVMENGLNFKFKFIPSHDEQKIMMTKFMGESGFKANFKKCIAVN